MAKKNGVPSQECVPHQVKFPHEAAANMDIPGTSRPRTDASSGFPGEFPLPDVRTVYGMYEGEFMHRSHTNGKKRE